MGEDGLAMRGWTTVVARFAGALVVASLLIVGVARDAVAQEATPVGEVVPPEECTTEPRPVRFLAELIATPVATPQADPLSDIPTGAEPDEQTRAEVIAHLRQIVACTNTGEFLRALALYSDDYLRRTADPFGLLTEEGALEATAELATPVAISAELYIRVVDFPLIELLDDGRVVAVMTTIPFGGGAPSTDLFLLSRAETDTGWTVDATIANFGYSAATPTP